MYRINFRDRLVDRFEHPTGNEVPFDIGKPQFNLVEPRRVGGREVKGHLGMLFEKSGYPLGLVGGQMVQNDVNLSALGLGGYCQLEPIAGRLGR